MSMTVWIILLFILIFLSFICGWFGRKLLFRMQLKKQEKENNEKIQYQKKLLNESRAEAILLADKIVEKAKKESFKMELKMTQKIRQQNKREKQLLEIEEMIEKRNKSILSKEDHLQKVEDLFKEKTLNLNKKLFEISSLSEEEAKKLVFQNIEKENNEQLNELIKKRRRQILLDCQAEAVSIISQAIERYASQIVTEKTTNLIEIENDNIKGRIIGKEGRNIKTFQSYAGVDLIIDDTPNMVQVSCFDPIRREIAVRALKNLIIDGRIQPIKIEEFIDEAKANLDVEILNHGKKAVEDLAIFNIDTDLIKLIGRLYYRTSYNQNVLMHSIEVAKLAAIIAAEMNLDVKLAKRAGLLHDIGKAVDQSSEGSHVTIGAKIAAEFNEDPIIRNAILAHHSEYKAESVYAIIVRSADALSAARPGTRTNNLEDYITRMKEIEAVCRQVKGVKQAFVYQAGREIQVIVDPKVVNDKATHLLSLQVMKEIKAFRYYPGDININVLRQVVVRQKIQ